MTSQITKVYDGDFTISHHTMMSLIEIVSNGTLSLLKFHFEVGWCAFRMCFTVLVECRHDIGAVMHGKYGSTAHCENASGAAR